MQYKPQRLTLTLIQAVAAALRMHNRPMNVQEIHKVILEAELYEFGGETIEGQRQSVRGTLRKQCERLNFVSASPDKYFVVRSTSSRRDSSLSKISTVLRLYCEAEYNWKEQSRSWQ